MQQIKIKQVHPEARIPAYGTDGAAALDLCACTIGGDTFMNYSLAPGGRVKIGTGLAIALNEDIPPPFRMAGLILPRSGLGSRGITLGNAPGLLDEDYQGELLLALWNSSDEAFSFNRFDRLAQLLITPILKPKIMVVTSFDEVTARGSGGFGSTGK